ncbi:unnamed protein product, partial [Haemonchus placei]|uniref:Fibronectin type-III domain-containing protein n=1 Tax=Haemonchus placei TaxID=6290 RepID=A0A0N4XB65_HAEPC
WVHRGAETTETAKTEITTTEPQTTASTPKTTPPLIRRNFVAKRRKDIGVEYGSLSHARFYTVISTLLLFIITIYYMKKIYTYLQRTRERGVTGKTTQQKTDSKQRKKIVQCGSSLFASAAPSTGSPNEVSFISSALLRERFLGRTTWDVLIVLVVFVARKACDESDTDLTTEMPPLTEPEVPPPIEVVVIPDLKKAEHTVLDISWKSHHYTATPSYIIELYVGQMDSDESTESMFDPWLLILETTRCCNITYHHTGETAATKVRIAAEVDGLTSEYTESGESSDLP